MKNLQYLDRKENYLELSFMALQDQFSSMAEFIAFFNSIEGDEKKDQFLKIASYYLFIVKKGDWIVDIPNSDPKIGYLTETYKYIGLFSLIESLNKNTFIDFYTFLIRTKSNIKFPIKNKTELDNHYRQYKKEFGAIQQAVSFFKSLTNQTQEKLTCDLKVNNTNVAIEELAKYLYELRSEFVHQAKLIVNMSSRTTIGKRKNKIFTCSISIKDLMAYFEEGFISLFGDITICNSHKNTTSQYF